MSDAWAQIKKLVMEIDGCSVTILSYMPDELEIRVRIDDNFEEIRISRHALKDDPPQADYILKTKLEHLKLIREHQDRINKEPELP